ncbi:hypothetical protein Tco_0924918 [Tanacetum coccineum]|uniref:Transmembrane protein n=1 Tax=Tanacetum coccineum TaxID=301880 RepID=A0ABQ5DBJ9_9ASTR
MAAGKTNAPDVGVTTAKRTRCGVTVEPNSPFSGLNSGGGVEEEAGQRRDAVSLNEEVNGNLADFKKLEFALKKMTRCSRKEKIKRCWISALALITLGWAAAFASPPVAMSFAMIVAGAAKSEAAPPTPTINIHLKLDSSTLLERKSNKLHTFSSFQESLHASKKSSAANLKDKAAARATTLAVACDLKRNNKISSQRGLSVLAMATSSQRRSKHDMERVMRWNVSEAMGIAWMESFARNMQLSKVDRRARFDFIAQHRRCTGIHAWRKLIHYLIETDSLFGLLIKRFCNPKRVLNCVFGFWKIDYMETFTRMHRCLRRDFKGLDHSGIFAVSEDPLKLERDKQNSVLALEALSSLLVNEDDDQDAFVNVDFNIDEMWLHEDIQTRPSAITEQQLFSIFHVGGNQMMSPIYTTNLRTSLNPYGFRTELYDSLGTQCVEEDQQYEKADSKVSKIHTCKLSGTSRSYKVESLELSGVDLERDFGLSPVGLAQKYLNLDHFSKIFCLNSYKN